jgi:hypothetical protein
MGKLTILWIELADGDEAVLRRAADLHRADVVAVKRYSLASQTFAAVALGPVLFVARTAREASLALRTGVDEVVRAGELTDDGLAASIERARARAEGRATHDLRRSLFHDDGELAFATLTSALGRRAVRPLEAAAEDCRHLLASIPPLVGLMDRVLEDFVIAHPVEQTRPLVSRRVALPRSAELQQRLAAMETSLTQAAATVRSMEHLGGAFALQPTPIAPLIAQLVDTMRVELEPWATVDLRTDGPCATFVAPVGVALILVLALTSALDSIRASGTDPGHIGVFVTEVEEAVVLDVRDNGRHPSRLLESHLDTRRNSGISLFRLRDRLRSCGGDLLVDADETGTLVRAMLPVSPESASDEPTSQRARRKVYEQPG